MPLMSAWKKPLCEHVVVDDIIVERRRKLFFQVVVSNFEKATSLVHSKIRRVVLEYIILF